MFSNSLTTRFAALLEEYPQVKRGSTHSGMLALAQAGRFQHPPDGMSYDAPTDCRVDEPHGFDVAPVYLCAISIVGQGSAGGHLWEWAAQVEGTLHTNRTDPAKIPTITGPWDPPWQQQ